MSGGAATELQRERAEGDVDSIGMSYLSLVDLGCELKVLQLRDAHLGGGVGELRGEEERGAVHACALPSRADVGV